MSIVKELFRAVWVSSERGGGAADAHGKPREIEGGSVGGTEHLGLSPQVSKVGIPPAGGGGGGAGYALEGGDSDRDLLENQGGADTTGSGGAANDEVPNGAFGEWNRPKR